MSPAQQTLMSPAQKDVALVPQPSETMALFERLATDPNVSVEKIERLMALAERAEARRAEAAFNVAMSAAQKAMRPVMADAYNPQTKSKYASYEQLDRAVRPIYTEHGFGLSFDTGKADQELCVLILCYVTHIGGHSRTYKVEMPADGKGAKGGDVMTRTHATGSGMSYGQRYLLKLIFNIAVGEGDDDGNAAGRQAAARDVVAPNGFEEWWTDLQAAGEDGWETLKAAWNKSPDVFRVHVQNTNARGWEAIRRKASAKKAGGRP